MTLPQKTFELRISFSPDSPIAPLKERVKSWLVAHGRETFVEGHLEHLYLDHCYENPDRDFFAELGGEESPIPLYHFQ